MSHCLYCGMDADIVCTREYEYQTCPMNPDSGMPQITCSTCGAPEGDMCRWPTSSGMCPNYAMREADRRLEKGKFVKPKVPPCAGHAFQEEDDPTSPSHYSRWAIEPLEFIMANNLPFWLGNVIKYTMRYDAKNGLEDLKKARVYLDRKIKELEG